MSVVFELLAIEKMSDDDIYELGVVQLGATLRAIAIGVIKLNPLANQSRLELAAANNAFRKDKSVYNREAQEIARCDVANIADRSRMFRDLKSTIQTLIRTMP